METRNRSYLEVAKSTPEEVQARKKAAEERKRVREAQVEQPQNTAQEKPAEENVDKTVETVVETVAETVETGGVKQKQKRRKLAKETHSIDENPKISTTPGGGDATLEEHERILRETRKELKKVQQQLEEKERILNDSKAFFRAGSNPKADTTMDTTIRPPVRWQGYNRWAALFFSLGVQVDESDDELIDGLDMNIRQMSRDIGYPLKGREIDWEDIAKIFKVRFTLIRRGRKGKWESMHIPAMANDDRIEVRIELKNTAPMQYEVERRGSLERLSPQMAEDPLQVMMDMSEEINELVQDYKARLAELYEDGERVDEMENSEKVDRLTKVGGSSSKSKESETPVAPIIYVSQGQLPYLSVFEYKEVRYFVEKARKYYGTGGNPLIHPSTGLSESIKRLIAQWWQSRFDEGLQEDNNWEHWLHKFQSLSIERLQPRIGLDLVELQFSNDGIAKTQKFAYDVHEAAMRKSGPESELTYDDDVQMATDIIKVAKKKVPEFAEKFYNFLHRRKEQKVEGTIWEAVLSEITSTLQAEKTSLSTINARVRGDAKNNNNNSNYSNNNRGREYQRNSNNSYNNNYGYERQKSCWQCFGRLAPRGHSVAECPEFETYAANNPFSAVVQRVRERNANNNNTNNNNPNPKDTTTPPDGKDAAGGNAQGGGGGQYNPPPFVRNDGGYSGGRYGGGRFGGYGGGRFNHGGYNGGGRFQNRGGFSQRGGRQNFGRGRGRGRT